MKWLTLLVLASVSALASAKCRVEPQIHATSPNGRFELIIHNQGNPSGQFKIVELRSKREVGRGRLKLPGHHGRAFVSDRGDRVVLVDEYGGYGIFDAAGKPLAFQESRAILTSEEEAARPGRWTCHPEGVWLMEHRILDQRKLLLVLHSNRTILVPLYPSARS